MSLTSTDWWQLIIPTIFSEDFSPSFYHELSCNSEDKALFSFMQLKPVLRHRKNDGGSLFTNGGGISWSCAVNTGKAVICCWNVSTCQNKMSVRTSQDVSLLEECLSSSTMFQ